MTGNLALSKYLLKNNFVPADFDWNVISGSKKPLIQVLGEEKYLYEPEVLEHLSKEIGIPIILDEIDQINIPETLVLFSELSFQNCIENNYLPVQMMNGDLMLLVTDPFNLDIRQEIQFTFNRSFSVGLISGKSLERVLCRCDPHEAQTFDELANLEFGAQIEILNSPEDNPTKEDLSDPKAPIISIVNKLVVDAIKLGASDIHFEPSQWSLEVRYRIDGTLHRNLEIPKRLQKAITARIKLLSNMDISEHRKPQDGRLQLRINGEIIDLRVSCIPASNGECLVLRILRTDKNKLKIDKLHLPESISVKLRKAIKAEGKMVLVTGPTGSGKTTTLYSCLNELLIDSPNIVTVEDPIEYRLEGLNQVQVNELAGVTFASALRSIMRQDPDVILIGEIRDSETADIAIQAAQTGHLVLSTLHTNDAPGAITRLIDLGVEPFMVSASVAGVLAQRLVRRLCTHCSESLSNEEISNLKNNDLLMKYNPDFNRIKKVCGCQHCHGTGYAGRIGIFSFLEITREVSDVIHGNISLSAISDAAKTQGFRDLDSQAIDLLESGVTSLEEVLPYLASNQGQSSKKASDIKSKKKVGIISESLETIEKLRSVLCKKEEISVNIMNTVEEDDVDIVIIDDTLPLHRLEHEFALLSSNKNHVPLVYLGQNKGTDVSQKTNIIYMKRNSSPLAIANKCLRTLKC
jgi:type IV pilus assembly protein PilB